MKKRINITMEEWMLKQLDQYAKERGLDRSTVISILVYDQLALIDYCVSEGQLDHHADALDNCGLGINFDHASHYMKTLKIK